MKILLLNEYFPPDTSATANMAAAVVDALAERHEVTVLCGRPSYDPSERHPFYLSRLEIILSPVKFAADTPLWSYMPETSAFTERGKRL